MSSSIPATITTKRTVTNRLTGYNNTAVDFDVRPTIAGAPFSLPASTIPTLAATSTSLLSAGGVTFNTVRYNVDGNALVSLSFQAVCTTTTNTNSLYASFQVALPNLTTSFTDTTGLVAHVNAKDVNGAVLTDVYGEPVPSSKNVIVNFFPNSPVATTLNITLIYKLQ